ncbi:MAG: RNA-binding domain-containing protein [Euryarchaeota archaeon]|nr:RNA-binding domain-containing protein [Euryarchaeota archaeon]
MFTLKIRVEVHPTEDEEKVREAVGNIFPIELEREETYLIGNSTEIASLDILKERLENQNIRDTARSILFHRIHDNKLTFMLNKQTASVGVVNFLESASLGVIEVEIKTDNLGRIIDFIAPSTVENEDF